MWLYFLHFVVDECVSMYMCVCAGVHTLQQMYSCELDHDGTIRGFWLYGYDGEDFISFDLNTETWTAPTAIAVTTKRRWESEDEALHVKAYLQNECTAWLLKFEVYSRSSLA